MHVAALYSSNLNCIQHIILQTFIEEVFHRKKEFFLNMKNNNDEMALEYITTIHYLNLIMLKTWRSMIWIEFTPLHMKFL